MQYTSKEVYEFVSRQTNDPIIEWKICAVSGTEFPIYQSDLEFYNKISPTFAGQKFQIPTPTLCPEERQRRRLSLRNERKLYRRKCDATGETIVSIYSPDKPYKVYDQKVWQSDSWNPLDYGIDFDFSKTFRENFENLLIKMPRPNVQVVGSENCDYTNYSYYNHDSYLIFGALNNNECFFCDKLGNCVNCIDCKMIIDCTNCYQCIGCSNSNNLYYSISSKNCNFSYGLVNCENCEFCINCSNLINSKYYINNKPVSQTEYEKYKQHLKFQTNNNVSLATKLINSEQCFGNEIYNSNQCSFVFDVHNSNSCKYIWDNLDGIDSIDCYGTNRNPLSLECLSVIRGHLSIGNMMCIESQNCFYSQLLTNCLYCFGCIGLRNKQYCIFNKQYTKEEYEVQVAKIIAHMQSMGEWGEFFHPSLSDFGYKWSTYSSDPVIPSGVQTIERKNYTDEQRENLKNNDEILKQTLICEVSGRPYRIVKQELEFYRKHNLPIPSKHPDVRHEERIKLRPGRTLYLRNCDCCCKEMLSVYDKDHEGRVYCEQCYQKEVFG